MSTPCREGALYYMLKIKSTKTQHFYDCEVDVFEQKSRSLYIRHSQIMPCVSHPMEETVGKLEPLFASVTALTPGGAQACEDDHVIYFVRRK